MTVQEKQLEQLFKPINPKRIKTSPQVFGSFLETWDVIAHLSRIFGPLNWSKHVLESHLIFEEQTGNKWTVCYGATVELVVRVPWVEHTKISVDCATGTATNQPSRGDAHDLALKTAVSDALKRAAKDLGNQFGLSLYDGGSTQSVLGESLAHPRRDNAGTEDSTPSNS